MGDPRETARRAELAAFLRARRARLQPRDVGLPIDAYGMRRTAGLRREEVAELAGVSLTWYTWLEQGRDIAASAQVVDALARALLLGDDDHRHLRILAGLPEPVREAHGDDRVVRARRLVEATMPNVASIYDIHFDYVAWNTAYARVRHDPARLPRERRNLLWTMFADQEFRDRLVRWEAAARAVLSQFRAFAGPDARRDEIVETLRAESAEFRAWWAEYPVRSFQPATIAVDHPTAGRIRLDLYQMRLVENPDLLMVLQVPAHADDLRRVLSLLP